MLDNLLKIFNIKLLLGMFFAVVFKKKHQTKDTPLLEGNKYAKTSALSQNSLPQKPTI